MAFARDISVMVAKRAVTHRDAVAVEDDGVRVTFGALHRRARRWAEVLRGLGAELDDRVAIDLPRSAELLVAMLACLEAGIAYVPLDVTFPMARKQALIRESGALGRTCDAVSGVTSDAGSGAPRPDGAVGDAWPASVPVLTPTFSIARRAPPRRVRVRLASSRRHRVSRA